MSVRAGLLLTRPRAQSATVAALQIAASAATTLLAFAVALLARAFWSVPSDEIGYPILAAGLVGVLLVPLATLGTATARLGARSRDDRLATLRLLGATAGRVRRLAVAEATLFAGIGVLAGSVASLALPAALGLLSVFGRPLDPLQLRLPWWLIVGIPPALVLVAALSALLGLRRVVLSPLGVRTRQDAPRLSWLRVVVALAVLGGAVLVVQTVSPSWGVAAAIGALGLAVLALMAVLGVVGPFACSAIARLVARRTPDPARLVAARGIEDDPRAAWRGVSALALATFILIPAGSLLGYLDTIARSQSREIMTEDQLLLFGDARTMLVVLVAVAFLIVACQAAITQTAAVLEGRELHVALDRIGMPRARLERARRLRATLPAAVAVIGSAAAAVAFAFPLVFIAVAVAPLFVVAIVAVLALGLLLIRAGAAVASPALRRVLAAPARGE
ncbi:FtsX-like permease family protein [Microbacterium sp. gxy059]|uniref:FtsX-like permease family protein n=1 Tax=Microbacterium sp. gxy059 TaxID=2957199 RepID=UPI003D96F5D6